MAPFSTKGESFWVATASEKQGARAPLPHDVDVDVAIVGGGIVGLTAALLLQRAGRSVAVIDAQRVGEQVTGRSTAKITSQHGLVYRQLEKNLGREGAKRYGEANQAGLAEIVRLSEELGIDCALERKDAYVYSRSGELAAEVEQEAEAARALGLPASYVRECPLPFKVAGAMRFENQAQFNPCAYLRGLARTVESEGGTVIEHTIVRSIAHGEPCRIGTDHGVVSARDVIDASHMPLISEGKFFAKAYPHMHPVVAARIDPARAPDGMFISAEQPTRSLRTARWQDDVWVIATGRAFKPGHDEEVASGFADLEAFLREELGAEGFDFRWTNEDYQPMDGVPFVGRATSGAPHLFVATGFNAWGITNGTAAAMLLCDLITKRSNPWAEVFEATRLKPLSGGPTLIRETLSTTAEGAGGYFRSRSSKLAGLGKGEGSVLTIGGKRLAVFRDEQDQIHSVSAICTHMKCVVGWNPVDRTWDCPCHGSRFTIEGKVIHGPATADLEPRPDPHE